MKYTLNYSLSNRRDYELIINAVSYDSKLRPVLISLILIHSGENT